MCMHGRMQVLDALPDEEFSMCLRQPHQLVSSTATAVKLPARLKVKWLRADCLSVLDLCAPEVTLTLPVWRSLVMCISVVPNLKQLALRLPRGEGRAANVMISANSSRPRPLLASTVPVAAVGQGAVGVYVSGEAIVALLHASNHLKSLRTLTLEDSPVAAADLGTFCDALVSFSGSLTELSIDAWKAHDTSTKPITSYDVSTRRQVLDSLARLKLLQELRIRDWANLVARDCEGGRVLSRLRYLKSITVGASFPCAVAACADGKCAHFDGALPFKSAVAA